MRGAAIRLGIPWRPILVSGADFNGSTDYMTTGAGLTGAADGKVGTVSFWFRLDGGDGTSMTMFHAATTIGGATSRFRVRHESNDTITVVGLNAAGSTILTLTTNATYTASATWLHFLASWDLANGLGNLYVSDVSKLAVGSTLTNDSIDYTVADWAIGAQANAGTPFNGCLSEFYFALEYTDLTSATVRHKFITSTIKPMYLGTDGGIPTGTAPIVYQHITLGTAVTTFATNNGTGGNFTITGTPVLSSTSPSA